MSTQPNDATAFTTRQSRRTLLRSAGGAMGLTIFWRPGQLLAQSGTEASPMASPEAGSTPEATPTAATSPSAPTNLDAYLRVNEDGTVTLFTGKVEFGPGDRDRLPPAGRR